MNKKLVLLLTTVAVIVVVAVSQNFQPAMIMAEEYTSDGLLLATKDLDPECGTPEVRALDDEYQGPFPSDAGFAKFVKGQHLFSVCPKGVVLNAVIHYTDATQATEQLQRFIQITEELRDSEDLSLVTDTDKGTYEMELYYISEEGIPENMWVAQKDNTLIFLLIEGDKNLFAGLRDILKAH